MRWSGRQVAEDGVGATTAVPGLRGLVRTARVPGPAGAVSRCLGGDTRVLMADGTSRPLAELVAGDAVVGTQDDGGGRRYVRTTVEARWSTRTPAVRVRLADGTVLTASAEHRFLTDRGWRHVTGGWGRSGRRPRLRPGDVLLGPGGAAVIPAVTPEAGPRPATPGYRRGYLCGVVRGDGAGPTEPDRCFPSVHLELEALGRAHHYLAGLPAGAARPGAAGPIRSEHRAAEHRAAPARAASRRPAAVRPARPAAAGSPAAGSPAAGSPAAGSPAAGSSAAGPPPAGPSAAGSRAGGPAPAAAGPGAAGSTSPAPVRLPTSGSAPTARTGPRRGCGAVVDGRIPPPWESAGEPVALPTPDEAAAWPVEAGEDWCAGFLAGVVDARGRVAEGVLRVRHADEEVIGRVAGALHRLGFRFVMEPAVRGERTVALAGGTGELVRLLRVIGPAVRREVTGAPVAAASTVTAVEETGREEDLHDLTTGTGDVVAEGVVSHDCSARRAGPVAWS